MSEHEWEYNSREIENGSGKNTGTDPFRWSFGEQLALDAERQRKQRRRGTFCFVLILLLVFAAVFATLAVTIVLSRRDSGDSPESGSASEVAALVTPSTVLIYSSNITSYSYGTGFFVAEDGYLVTNYHCVDGATSIRVRLYSGKELKATVVGFNATVDIAVLKISGSGYPVVRIGDSDRVTVGEKAIAIGNPSGVECAFSTTQGIISAVNRDVVVSLNGGVTTVKMIQTDAPVNPGNSGGPLCNAKGEVVGVVTKKQTDYESLGFALPINGVMEIVDGIIEKNKTLPENSDSHPTLGITVSNLAAGDEYYYMEQTVVAARTGVLVCTVNEGGASDGILVPSDVILKFNGTEVNDTTRMVAMLCNYKVGDKVTLTIFRNNSVEMDVTVTLGEPQ